MDHRAAARFGRPARCRQSSCMPVVARILPKYQRRSETSWATCRKTSANWSVWPADAAIALVLRVAVSEPASVRSLRDFGRVNLP